MIVLHWSWLSLSIWEVNDRDRLKLVSTLHIEGLLFNYCSLYVEWAISFVQCLLVSLSLFPLSPSLICKEFDDVAEITIDEEARKLKANNGSNAVKLRIFVYTLIAFLTNMIHVFIRPYNSVYKSPSIQKDNLIDQVSI